MMVWFPCYVNDLLGSLRWKCMTPAQRGAYWQLICWQMQAEDGHLPADVKALSVLADLDLAGDNANVVDAFPLDDTGKRANQRALREWTKRQSVSATRSEVGSKGIAKRWQTDSNCYSKPIASAATTTTTSTTDNAQPEITATPTRRKRASAPLYRWDEFAAIYPPDKLIPDAKAKGWWRRRVTNDEQANEVLAGTRAWVCSRQYAEGFGFGCCRFLTEELWRKIPTDTRPLTKGERITAHNRKVLEEVIAQEGHDGSLPF